MCKPNLKRFIKLTLILICIAGFYACSEPDMGCLDALSSNFDLEADQDCCVRADECCCTYPNLSLGITYKLTSQDSLDDPRTNFKLGDCYPLDNLTDSIQIDTLQFFIYGLKPHNSALLDSICVTEIMEYNRANTSDETEVLSIEDNFALIDGIQFRYDLGTYQSDLETDRIDFTIGLPENIAQINPDDIITDNLFKNTYSDLYDQAEGIYASIRINITIKSGEKQRNIIETYIYEQFTSTSLLNPLVVSKGDDLNILMRINVLDIFKGTIFDVSNEDLQLIITNNIENSISILGE